MTMTTGSSKNNMFLLLCTTEEKSLLHNVDASSCAAVIYRVNAILYEYHENYFHYELMAGTN